ncbi:Receptor L domain-containing protein [Candidatus Frackibacter sp. WG12]|uniref:hypothetical protein n=1 Tax=Candidatus Frackibacter sp. WG12 TaxID=2017977 RepID=UPI0008B6FA38|nr:hypothetical protein [Candidatus Frackibacter sp. WG12]SEM54914.1 Receptor L domain-containing protein [Candidatus Frackibacter sp. WG12]
MKRKILILSIMMLCLLSVSAFIYASNQQDMKDKKIVINGDFILTDDNYEKAKSIEVVKGNLKINTTKIASMPNLKEVVGIFYTGKKAKRDLQIVSFPLLETVSILYFESLDNLKEINMPNLKTIKGELHVARNFKLKQINFHQLKEIQGSNGNGINIEYNDNLEGINLPRLQYVGGYINIHENYDLKELDFSHLKKVNKFLDLISCNNINYLNLKSLKKVGGLTINGTKIDTLQLNNLKSVGSFGIWDNDFKAVNLPQLNTIKYSFSIRWNDNLEIIYAPKLMKIGTNLDNDSIIADENKRTDVLIEVNKIPKYKGTIKNAKFKIIRKEE